MMDPRHGRPPRSAPRPHGSIRADKPISLTSNHLVPAKETPS